MKSMHLVVTFVIVALCIILLAQSISFHGGNNYRHNSSIVFVVKRWIHVFLLIHHKILYFFQLGIDFILISYIINQSINHLFAQ